MVSTQAEQIITLSIFILSYILIFSGRVDRTTAALFGVFLMLGVGYCFSYFTFEDLILHIDWEVIILLFGMMTYVGLMAKTGFFKYLGIKALKLSKGRPFLIFTYLTLITTFVSMLIDNVTTILLIIPLTVEVCEMLDISPVPVILGEAVLSNVGGVGTMIGDPPNIMIGSAADFTFTDFIVHLMPAVLLSMVVSLLLSALIFRKWRKSVPKNLEHVLEMDPHEKIRDPKRMKILLIILIGMVAFFSTEEITGISPAFVAVAGGTLALVVCMEEPKKAFKAVEWTTLVFFAALFTLVGGLEETGVLSTLADSMMSISSDALILAIVLLWLSGLSSAVVDNIPITAALIPVVTILSAQYNTNLLWWALALGVGMGGNITPIGSSAGVISLSLSSRYGYEISNREWFKYGSTIGISSMLISTLFLVIIYTVF